jgi:hypothetical protein
MFLCPGVAGIILPSSGGALYPPRYTSMVFIARSDIGA